MASQQNEIILNIRINATLSKLMLILVPHLITALLLFIFIDSSGLSLSALSLSMLIIIISFIYFIKLHLSLDLNKSIVALKKDLNDCWTVKYKDNKTSKVTITASSFVSDLLLLINIKDESGKYATILITKDSLSPDKYRRLKVYIRTNKLVD